MTVEAQGPGHGDRRRIEQREAIIIRVGDQQVIAVGREREAVGGRSQGMLRFCVEIDHLDDLICSKVDDKEVIGIAGGDVITAAIFRFAITLLAVFYLNTKW